MCAWALCLCGAFQICGCTCSLLFLYAYCFCVVETGATKLGRDRGRKRGRTSTGKANGGGNPKNSSKSVNARIDPARDGKGKDLLHITADGGGGSSDAPEALKSPKKKQKIGDSGGPASGGKPRERDSAASSTSQESDSSAAVPEQQEGTGMDVQEESDAAASEKKKAADALGMDVDGEEDPSTTQTSQGSSDATDVPSSADALDEEKNTRVEEEKEAQEKEGEGKEVKAAKQGRFPTRDRRKTVRDSFSFFQAKAPGGKRSTIRTPASSGTSAGGHSSRQDVTGNPTCHVCAVCSKKFDNLRGLRAHFGHRRNDSQHAKMMNQALQEAAIAEDKWSEREAVDGAKPAASGSSRGRVRRGGSVGGAGSPRLRALRATERANATKDDDMVSVASSRGGRRTCSTHSTGGGRKRSNSHASHVSNAQSTGNGAGASEESECEEEMVDDIYRRELERDAEWYAWWYLSECVYLCACLIPMCLTYTPGIATETSTTAAATATGSSPCPRSTRRCWLAASEGVVRASPRVCVAAGPCHPRT
jgi:hypothetical protein